MIREIRKASPGLLTGLLIVLVLTLLRGYDPTVLSTLRGAGFDGLQRLWPRETIEFPVRIVDIDEASLAKRGQWPWPRTDLARLVEELSALGAAVIAFDIIFPEPDRMSPSRIVRDSELIAKLGIAVNEDVLASFPDNDRIFADAIRTRPVILAFSNAPGSANKTPKLKAGFAQTGEGTINAAPRISAVATNIEELDEAASGIGSINVDLAAEQGIARQIPLLWSDGTDFYPSLVVEALRVAQGANTVIVHGSDRVANAIETIRVGEFEIPVAENSLFALRYRRDNPATYVSAARILAGDERDQLAPLIAGHIVFIGTSAAGLLDVRTTSLGESVPGVSIHAQAIEQILSGDFLVRPEWAAGAEIMTFAILGLAIVAVVMLLTPLAATLAGLLSLVFLASVSIYAFRSAGLLVDMTFPATGLAVTFLSTLAFRLLVTDSDRRMLRNSFGHFVSPSVLAEIERNPDALKLGGEVRDVTVVFVDIRDFTPLSERLAPEALVSLINQVLDKWSDAIMAEGGTIDKYIGDAVMAFWNAPVAQPDHQGRAARAALGIRRALVEINARESIRAVLEPRGLWPLRLGVGISSGPACVGNMGSKERFDYSVVGETVNTAARTEAASKHVGFDIVIAGDIHEAARGLAVLPAGNVAMKGRSHNSPTWIVVGDEALADTAAFAQLRQEHDALIKAVAKAGAEQVAMRQESCRMLAAGLDLRLQEFYERIARRPADFAA